MITKKKYQECLKEQEDINILESKLSEYLKTIDRIYFDKVVDSFIKNYSLTQIKKALRNIGFKFKHKIDKSKDIDKIIIVRF